MEFIPDLFIDYLVVDIFLLSSLQVIIEEEVVLKHEHVILPLQKLAQLTDWVHFARMGSQDYLASSLIADIFLVRRISTFDHLPDFRPC